MSGEYIQWPDLKDGQMIRLSGKENRKVVEAFRDELLAWQDERPWDYVEGAERILSAVARAALLADKKKRK